MIFCPNVVDAFLGGMIGSISADDFGDFVERVSSPCILGFTQDSSSIIRILSRLSQKKQ